MTTPETSIVIRTLNEAKYLGRLLQGIHDQNYKDWEIVLVDSGSTDGTREIAERYGARIFHIPKEEFTFGRSLNCGCREARGKYLVFASGHVWPTSNTWLRNLVRTFEDSKVGMVYGSQRAGKASALSDERTLTRMFGETSQILIDEPRGNNGNAAIRKDLWLEEPFDESLTGLEDIDWARRIQAKGYRVYYAADARILHIHEESLKQVYRRYFREALAYKRMSPRHALSPPYTFLLFAYAVAADFLYALRRRASLMKIARIVPYRAAESLGHYRGSRVNGVAGRQVLESLSQSTDSKTVVISAPAQHTIVESERPEAGPGEILMRVAYVGVCATDLEVLGGTLEYYQRGYAKYPITPGHEYSGVIVKVGDGVSRLRPGHKVVGECAVGCGNCDACARAEFYRCEGRSEVGVINLDGAYSQYLKLAARYIHRLPDDMSLKEAALIEPLAVCAKGVRKLEAIAGRQALIVGAGSLGNLLAQLLKHRGLQVTVLDRDERRLALLHKYDIDTLTSPEKLDRFDYLVESSGNEDMVPTLIEGSKPSAKILLLGLPYLRAVPTIFSTVTGYDKTIIGSVASQSMDWDEAIRLLHLGAVLVQDHTSTVLPLERYQAAWEAHEEKRHLKVLLGVSPELEAG